MHSVHGQHHTDINIGLMTELKCCQMHACDNAHIPVLEFIRLLQVLIRLDHRCFDVESNICKPFFDVTHNLLLGIAMYSVKSRSVNSRRRAACGGADPLTDRSGLPVGLLGSIVSKLGYSSGATRSTLSKG